MGQSNRLRHVARQASVARRNGNTELFNLPPPVPLEQDERYTTRETLRWCASVADVDAFDLDVAACRESHHAPRWWSIEPGTPPEYRDGLARRWDARRIWCNPPYSDIGPWVERAWRAMREREAEVIAMLIPASRTEQAWWQRHVEPWRDGRGFGFPAIQLTTHHPPGRTRFGFPGNPTGTGVGDPPFACVLLVWRATACPV